MNTFPTHVRCSRGMVLAKAPWNAPTCSTSFHILLDRRTASNINQQEVLECGKIWNASRICVSSLRRGHANLLCIVPILVYVPPKQARFFTTFILSIIRSRQTLHALLGVLGFSVAAGGRMSGDWKQLCFTNEVLIESYTEFLLQMGRRQTYFEIYHLYWIQ